MEDLPPAYIDTALPLILLSGLGLDEDENTNRSGFGQQENGARIITDSPECRTEQSSQVLQQFIALDGTRYAAGPSGDVRYKIKRIARSYTLPARKAAPSAKSPGAEGNSAPRSTELHSPLSPLSPGPLHPDGLFTPAWFIKHQHQVPCLFLSFFCFTVGEGTSQDAQIRSDINAAQGALSRSGYKTRFAAVLISDTSISEASQMEDRLNSIRRATGLDAKTLCFMPAQADIAAFVRSIMTSLHPACMEYYRDLTKHSRRKKARGGPAPQISSPAGGASQSTSNSAWNVRYDVKLGVFAEFRREMDLAERHFSAAIEELFSSEGGVLETTANWSPRWNEARLLCDSMALRLIRCQLWTGQTSGAAQSWQNYKVRMQDLIDRRGKGSLTYGWSAWEARWASIMSQVIQLAEVPTLQKSIKGVDESLDITAQYAPPEKTIASIDRLPPFNMLHHSGYWLRLFAAGIRARWARALAIPEEDRVPPGQSPASTVANRFVTYDTYLVLEPHEEMPISGQGAFDHAAEIGMVSMRAVEEFEARHQIRMSEQIRLELAEDFVRVGRYSDALSVLVALWEECTWREDSWSVPFEKLLRLLAECLNQDKSDQNAELLPALMWEFLALGLPGSPDRCVDIAKCLSDWDSIQPVSVLLQDKQRRSPVSAAFAFRNIDAHVGEAFGCQLVLTFNTTEISQPLLISRLEFRLGDTRTISIQHDAGGGEGKAASLSAVELEEADDGNLHGSANLNLQPSQKRILSLSMVFREAHTFSLTELSLYLSTPKFELAHKFAEDSIKPSAHWYIEHGGEVDSVLIPHMDTKSIDILPKPPKMRVSLSGLRQQYYCDEKVVIPVDLINEESETVQGSIFSSITSEAGDVFDATWTSNPEDGGIRTITSLEPSAESSAALMIEGPPDVATLTLTLVLQYNLLSDPNTALEKTLTFELAFAHPFETSFAFTPRLHLDAWPSYFDASTKGTEEAADGVPQLWQLEAQIASSIDHALTIKSLELVVNDVQGDSHCNVVKSPSIEERTLPASDKATSTFELVTQKFSLDDRRSSFLFLSLIVHWSHDDGSRIAATTTTIPRLTIPTAEPRVLCVCNNASDDTITLGYVLENPSTHFLTFAISMEASEDFAFSGPKYRALSLAPLSRHQVDYQLVLHKLIDSDDDEGFSITPVLEVVDSFYNKSLRVHPGGPRVTLDENKRISVWIPGGMNCEQ